MFIWRWTLLWIGLALLITSLICHWFTLIWQDLLHGAAALFLFGALWFGKVFSSKGMYKEEWSFVCLLVMISLYTISVLFF